MRVIYWSILYLYSTVVQNMIKDGIALQLKGQHLTHLSQGLALANLGHTDSQTGYCNKIPFEMQRQLAILHLGSVTVL